MFFHIICFHFNIFCQQLTVAYNNFIQNQPLIFFFKEICSHICYPEKKQPLLILFQKNRLLK
jgi:hypothetical protein